MRDRHAVDYLRAWVETYDKTVHADDDDLRQKLVQATLAEGLREWLDEAGFDRRDHLSCRWDGLPLGVFSDGVLGCRDGHVWTADEVTP